MSLGASFTETTPAAEARRKNSDGSALLISGEIQEKANCAAYFSIIVAMSGALMFGIDQGNYGLVQNFQSFNDFWCKGQDFDKDGFTCEAGETKGAPSGWTIFLSWGGSLITIGAAVGCITVGPIVSSRLGRRACISLGGIVCFCGCLFASYLTAKQVAVYYVGRFVTGFGVGICCFALPMYSSEVATPAVRGLMGSLFQFMVVLGGVIASLMLKVFKNIVSGGNWQLGMLLPGLAGAFVSIFIWFTPESPRFTMDKLGYEAGRDMLQKVRKGDVEKEARQMEAESEQEKQAGQVSYRELISDPNRRKRLFIACYLQIAQQLTGVNAFLSYTTEIFEGAGIKKDDVGTAAIGFNLFMLCGVIAGLSLVDSSRGGRRCQLLVATYIMGPPLLIAGISKLLHGPSWISIVALALYGPGFQFAWGIIPWIYPAEIFSMNEKDKAVSIAIFFEFGINFVVNMVTPSMLAASSAVTFVVFGLLNVSNLFFVLIFIKETKGIPLDRVPALFGSDSREVAPLHEQGLEKPARV